MASGQSSTFCYEVLGAHVRSDLELRELTAVATAPGSAVEVNAVAGGFPEGGELIRQITDRSEREPRVLLFEGDWGLRWEVRHVGTFWLSNDGRAVRYRLDPDLEIADAESVLTGPVLATAAQYRGELLLHGGAFVAAGRAIAFSAPHGFGKTTLTASIGRAGFPLLAEDIVHICASGEGFEVVPYLPGLKLWRDAFDGLAAEPDGAQPVFTWLNKHRVRAGGEWGMPCTEPMPLDVVYFLDPHEDPARRPAVRELTALESAIQLHASLYRAYALTGERSRRALDACAEVAERVPMRTLQYRRSFEELPAIRAALGAVPERAR